MITRAEYMDKNANISHRAYYGQFVTAATIRRVVAHIGANVIMASIDPDMNDIPLAKWDALVPNLPGSGGFTKVGDFYTLGTGVCLAKEAALQWREAQ